MDRFQWRIFLPFLVGIALFVSIASAQEPVSARQATFTVTSTADSGPGTLRQALLDANVAPNSGGPDLVAFDISGAGTHTIQLASPLPVITEAVVIDGTTQPGAECGADFASRNLLIEIDGSAVVGAGLTLASGGSTVQGLIINGFPFNPTVFTLALHITGNASDGNRVICNFFGTDNTGMADLNNAINITIDEGASENVIGGTASGEGNLFTGEGIAGISISDAGTDENRVEGNYFGLNATGSQIVNGFGLGVVINDGASGNIIGGIITSARNVFAGNAQAIKLTGATTTQNRVSGNYIGTNHMGTHCLGDNSNGIVLENTGANLIGGTEDGAGNLISCQRDAIFLESASGTTIQGNLIGTNAAGTLGLGNLVSGIWINRESTGTVVGGTVQGARNIISSNDNPGVNIWGAGTVVQGNYIGTDITGTAAISNRLGGISIQHDNNVVGGTTPGAANVIAGNAGPGIILRASGTGNIASGNIVQGNLIGVDATGTALLSNGLGVRISSGATDNTIGGTSAGAGNIIGGNQTAGILIQGEGTSDNIVQGNFIGTDATGRNLGNQDHGVWMANSSSENTIGGTEAGAGNVIAFNAMNGITVSASTLRHQIQGNQIYENNGLGIDLGDDGVTPNDAGDADEGANRLQNFPELTQAAQVDDGLALSFFVDTALSAASYPLTVEFFQADDSGTEGQVFLGRTSYSSAAYNACGAAPCELTVEIDADVALPAQILATATDAAGNTSEFSEAVSVLSSAEVSATKIDVVLNEHPDGVARPGDEIAYTIEIANTGEADATAVVFSDTPDANTQLVAGSVTTSQGTVTTGNTSGDEAVVVSLGTLASAAATIQFRVRVNDHVSAEVEAITNQGTVDGSNFEEVTTDDPDVGGEGDVTSTPLEVPARLMATKEAILQEDQDGDGRADSNDIIEYTIELLSTDGVARDVVFQDTLDAHTTLITGSVLTSLVDPIITMPGDTTVVVEIGTLQGESTVIIQFKAIVNAELPAGTTHIRNQGWFTGENADDLPTDDPATSPVGDATLLVADDGTGTAIAPEEEVAEHLQLLPNYPNPFVRETIIPFTLPQPMHLTLTVFDVQGREVMTLLDRHLPAGQHSVKWRAEESPAGIYFVRLQTNAGQRSYQIALMK